MELPWILISMLVALVTIGFMSFLIFLVEKDKRKGPNYYSFFAMGIIWLPLGIILKNYALGALGFIFLIFGLVHKNQWEQNRVAWKSLNKKEKMFKLVVIITLGLIFLAGLVLLLYNI